MRAIDRNNEQIVRCRRCPRLVRWREDSAADPPARFRGDDYWARPVPGFGDPQARVLLVGLAPGAHGANRTGRVFTGDRSGDWLYRALFETGFANQPTSTAPDDGLVLMDCYIAAAVRCAPPANKPLPGELANCRPFLCADMQALGRLQVIVALGSIGWQAAVAALRDNGEVVASPKPKFGHGAETTIGSYRLIGSYHPSPHNTSTGRLSRQALSGLFELVRSRLF